MGRAGRSWWVGLFHVASFAHWVQCLVYEERDADGEGGAIMVSLPILACFARCACLVQCKC